MAALPRKPRRRSWLLLASGSFGLGEYCGGGSEGSSAMKELLWMGWAMEGSSSAAETSTSSASRYHLRRRV